MPSLIHILGTERSGGQVNGCQCVSWFGRKRYKIVHFGGVGSRSARGLVGVWWESNRRNLLAICTKHILCNKKKSLRSRTKARWPSWLWREVKVTLIHNFLMEQSAWVQVPLLSLNSGFFFDLVSFYDFYDTVPNLCLPLLESKSYLYSGTNPYWHDGR
ncbi:hypothetical protein GGR54DRAFT_209733 [Hypoxylon sp. NC1633]|nr:hypothetical protein GGR54DRAFT_209733 [Hypoxylon sp. NC1633]